MDTATLVALAQACAPAIHPSTTQALVHVESSLNPYAIGVVGGVLDRQPRTRGEAVATVNRLRDRGWNFSAGLAQINVGNFDRLGLTAETVFDACTNLAAMQAVLIECFGRARAPTESALRAQDLLRRSLSCYYSGNFSTGFRHGYVRRVANAAARQGPSFTSVTEAP